MPMTLLHVADDPVAQRLDRRVSDDISES